MPRASLAVGPSPFARLVLLALLVGCATQREQRISSADARERPSDEPCEPTGGVPSAGAHWVCGYWHWAAVRYVWVEGRWDRAPRSAPSAAPR